MGSSEACAAAAAAHRGRHDAHEDRSGASEPIRKEDDHYRSPLSPCPLLTLVFGLLAAVAGERLADIVRFLEAALRTTANESFVGAS